MTILTTCLLLALLALLHWVWPQLWLRAHRRHLAALCRANRVIAITFDDGPGRLLTPLVSDRLAEAATVGTFFLLATNVRGNEDIVEQLVQRGHEIGSHGDRHVHHMFSWPWAGVLDTRDGWRRLRDVTGVDVRGIPFRPPYGKLCLPSMLYVRAQGTPIVLWTHDSFDTRLGVDKTPAELAAELRADGGGVVLLHDFDRSLANARQAVLAKLDAVLALRDEGFRFVRASELVGLSARA
ncbi:MAG: polysaccharide deacetylase family protein [Planctomycetota bacterium]